MSLHYRICYKSLLPMAAVFALAGVVACSDDDGAQGAPVVTVVGPYSVPVGETLALQASTTGATDSGYTWSSSDESIATVDGSGVVTGIAAGEVLISATGADSGVTGEHPVVVLPAGTTGEAVVSVTGDVFLRVGQVSQFSASTTNGTDSSYRWASDSEAVATVDATTGEVTAHAPGDVTITATGVDTNAAGSLSVHVSVEIPNEEAWLASGHADYGAEAFNHWNSDGEVPVSCARCHGGSAGFRDYLGDDGTAAFQVDNPAPIGGVVDCNTCHNPTAAALSTVIFPSGVQIDSLGPDARCMACHQGRESGDSVNTAIDDAGGAGAPDAVAATLGFKNIHYLAAGATLYAGRVRGGYEYAGQSYDWRFRHVPGKDTCLGCHDPHTLEVKVTECNTCHTGVASVDDLKDIRMMSSVGHDYDGDGDTSEGIYYEIQGLRTKLLTAIQTYAAEQTGTAAICYEEHTYPYFFIDTNGDGACDTAEASYANKYASWTPRLLRAAYNYQLSTKDPGAFAHNAKYVIELLYDSITDLNSVLSSPVDMAAAVRTDTGHFDGSAPPFRHWDTDPAISASCVKCHGGAEGFRFYLEYGVGKDEVEPGNGLDCMTCHNDMSNPSDVAQVASITFPGGGTHDMGDNQSNLCGTCHSGRESTATLDAAIASGDLSFKNVHYLAAAGVRAGTDARVGYEYAGKSYSAQRTHHNGCTQCHSPAGTNHTFHIDDNWTAGGCSACHGGTSVDTADFRLGSHASQDFDGDGTSDTLKNEVQTIAAALFAELQSYASTTLGVDICYAPNAYPYFFIDTDGSSVCDNGEAVYGNKYAAWDAPALRAAFNYQLSQKEPGAWAHNFEYIIELLIDSLDDLGGSGTSAGLGFSRPTP